MALVEYTPERPGAGLITLNDPDKLNAMSEGMAQEFRALTERLSGESALRVLIITGAGRAFSAGGDLKMLLEKTTFGREENRQRMITYYEAFLSIRKLGVPIIAALNGHAIGAGLCLACACDIRVAAEGAKLGLTFTKLGLHPGMGATYFLPKIIGSAAALELMLTGRVIEASEALRLGLISAILSPAELLTRARAIADEILGCGPLAVRGLLQTVRAGSGSLVASLEREAHEQSINYAGAEFAEGVHATMEKRTPRF